MWMALFIGSSSIQKVSIQRSFEEKSRLVDTRIDQLKEVVRKIQNGEQVDVEAALGTGNEQDEKDWEEGEREFCKTSNQDND